MDFEVEFAAFICQGNGLGEPIKIGDANKYIFGYVALNDWSSRDIQ
jgi:fumarylacetoacetase